ncbi:hypothetical protein [Prochlorococcus sp. MIT 1306]|uniref:hypothetical protein n=1 Tax=Prochlorococcus sp. MIT 1306 TaxID=1799667 RepID=UPI0007B36C41|nr:hypothetical protein [Prochlorococcus sp. MIT 1306]KZR65512.1 hypothetical protein PMIT1306_00424 [Prochlorococcus sp. MIT 1306]
MVLTSLGYQWLNGDRSWIFGLNADNDSRPVNTGDVDTYIKGAHSVSDNRDVFFSYIASGVEAFSNSWNFNGYAQVSITDVEIASILKILGEIHII